MKIGLLREEKKIPEHRVVLTPQQCKWIHENMNLKIVVESSSIRCFLDQEYLDLGIDVVEDLSDCDVLLGIKEMPAEKLIPNKKYFYFSHTIKKQPYNKDLLKSMIELNIEMIDYEALKDANNQRIIGFGRYAGIVGAYNAFRAFGLKSNRYFLKPAYQCEGRKEADSELLKVRLHNKIILTGNGRVSNGVVEILNQLNIKEVSKKEFINADFDQSVYCRLETMDYYQRIDGNILNKDDFYNNPKEYKSSFMEYAKHADIFIAGHFYADGSPFLYTRRDVNSEDFNIKVVADISCDIDGPVASTIRSSTIEDPIYGYNPETESEDNFLKDGVIAVMAVDNLPCELPKESSKDFGNNLIHKVLPLLLYDKDRIIERATICKDGDLTLEFEYLRNYIK